MSGNRLPVVTPAKSIRPTSRSSRLMLIASSSVIVHNLDIPRGSLAPFEADPPLIVDPDAVLTAPVAVQSFKTIARRDPQIAKLPGRIDGEQLGSRAGLNLIRQSF